MADLELPQSVKQLIADHIVAVEQLEILLLMARDDTRSWSPGEVSEEMRTGVTSARSRLDDLTRRGFLVREDGRFRYRPANLQLAQGVTGLAEAYAERRYTIIDLIFAKPIENLRVYADAFRFRKDDPDG